MSTPVSATGRCLCGHVAFSVTGPLRDVVDCHCHRCRRWTGHHMAATAADPRDMKYEATDTLRWFSPEPTVEYGFCSNCGSSVFWRVIGATDSISICAGLLDTPTGLRTVSAWWLSEASDYAPPSPGIADRQDTE